MERRWSRDEFGKSSDIKLIDRAGGGSFDIHADGMDAATGVAEVHGALGEVNDGGVLGAPVNPNEHGTRDGSHPLRCRGWSRFGLGWSLGQILLRGPRERWRLGGWYEWG